MAYQVKEIFYTLQGEGANAGRPAVFCRFAGCNLWSGREADRASAVCRFCDTDFVGTDGLGGGRFETAQDLADRIDSFWPTSRGDRLVVLTGGEPLLQVDEALTRALRAARFVVAVETNGTIVAPAGIDWICVSPKAGAPVVQRSGSELKVVMPQAGMDLTTLESWQFDHYLVQPMDGPDRDQAVQFAIEWCLAHPKWRLSLQTHKIIGLR